MANGDDAVAAGMQAVSSTASVRDGYDEINLTRDYIAQRTSAVQPIAKGGTGATTAADARTNLDVYKKREAIKSDNQNNEIALGWGGGRISIRVDASDIGDVAVTSDFAGYQPAGNYVVQSGGDIYTGGGRFNSQGSRNFPVSVNYASAYMDGNNWLGITPSALRFKQDVERFDYSLADALKLADCVATYRLKSLVEEQGEDATGEVGVIAEWLIDAGFPEFVIRDAQGAVQSVAYERLSVVAFGGLAELATKFDDLAARFDAFEEAAA